MAMDTGVDLVALLRQAQLLDEPQLQELARLRVATPDPRHLARHLIDRGWMTPYQINQLFQKRGQELVMGQYVLLERLGEGGMGQVFKARHRRLDRLVALKIIRREHVANQDAVRRFRREIQATASLSHPNIVLAYDADQAGDTHFFVMEYVDGVDMSSLLKRLGPPPVVQSCDYIRQASLGFQHAHEKGMVHRDVKPSNLLVSRSADASAWGTTVKILDMGVARLLQPPDGLDSVSALTRDGRVVGTPDYMAPEQAANSSKADVRSDLYSLGCTFYQLLAGRVPFPGGTPMEKLLKHRIEQPAPLEQLRPEVPPSVAAIVRKLMAKKPDERFQTPLELSHALERMGALPQAIPLAAPGTIPARANGPNTSGPVPIATLVSQGPPGAAPDRERLKRWILIGTGVSIILAGLLFLSLALFFPGNGRKATGKASLDTTGENPLTVALRDFGVRVADPHRSREPMLRRDLLRFRQQNAGSPQAIEAGKLLTKLPSPLDDLKVEKLGPDVVAVLGEPRQRHGAPVQAVALRRDGGLAASGDSDGVIRLWSIDADGNLKEGAALSGHAGRIFWLSFLPDGATLVSASADGTIRFWEGMSGAQPREIVAYRLAVVNGGGAVALSPDGQTLAVSLGTTGPTVPGGFQLYDLKNLTPKMPPRLRGPARRGHRGGVHALAFSPDNKLLATVGDDSQVFLWDAVGEEAKPTSTLPKAAGVSHAAAFSPDGKQLVAGLGPSILRWSLDGAAPAELPALKVAPAFAEVRALAFDAKGWLFTGHADAALRLWEPDDTGFKGPTLFGRGHTYWVNALAVDADKPRLLSGGQDTTVRLWNLAAAPPAELSPLKEPAGMVSALAFAPDGKTIAVAHDGDPAFRLYDPTFAAPPVVHKTGGGWLTGLAYTPDGQLLAAGGVSEPLFYLWPVAEGKLGASESLPGLGPRMTALAISPDGKTLAASDHLNQIRLCSLSGPKRSWRTLGTPRDPIQTLAFGPDGKTLAVAGPLVNAEMRSLRLWNLETGAESSAVSAGHVAALAFSPDGKTLASVGGGNTPDLRLWEIRGGTLKARPLAVLKEGPTLGLTGVAFLPDGESFIVCSRGGQASLMGTAAGQVLKTWSFGSPARGCALAPDGRYLAVGLGNGTVSLLRLPQGRP